MLKDFDLVPTLPAGDLERAKRFFDEKLGLTAESEDPSGVHYRTGSTRFDLYPTQFAGVAQHTLGGWQVQDLDGVMSQLRDRGVVFEGYDFPGLKTENGIATLGPERAAWFKDNEGNILALADRSG